MSPSNRSRLRQHGGSAATELITLLVIVALLIGGLVWCIRTLVVRLRDKPPPGFVRNEVTESTPPPASPKPAPTATPAPPQRDTSPNRSPRVPLVAPLPTAQTATASNVLTLPRDAAIVQRSAQLTFIGQSATNVRLLVKSSSPMSLRFSPVAALAPPAAAASPALFIAPHAPLAIIASSSLQTFDLPVVMADPILFLRPPAQATLELFTKPVDGILTTFLEAAAARSSDWQVIQAGVWILSRNTDAATLATLTLPMASPMTGLTAPTRVVDYREIKAVEGFILSFGWDADRYKAIQEENTAFLRILEQSDFQRRDRSYDALIASGALARYQGNSQIEQRLRDCMTQHPRFSMRSRAFTNLLAVGTSARTPDQLRHQAAHFNDARDRMLAAWALVAQGYDEGLPFLAICAADPVLGATADRAVTQIIATTSGLTRNPGETAHAYWTRTLRSPLLLARPEIERDIASAERQFLNPDLADMQRALAGLASPDESVVSRACGDLSRFNRSEAAFKALVRVATKHSSEQIRAHALNTLHYYRDYSPAAVCDAMLAEPNAPLAGRALSALFENIFDDSIPVIERASRHSQSWIRTQVARQIGEIPLPELDKVLVRISRQDTDSSAQYAARETLCKLHHPEALKVLTSHFRSSNRELMREALRLIPIWGLDADTTALLQKYRNDPTVGSEIEKLLTAPPASTAPRASRR